MCCLMIRPITPSLFFFFNDTATTEIYTLSLHDALPIYAPLVYTICTRYRLSNHDIEDVGQNVWLLLVEQLGKLREDRKSTRLNSSHQIISYAVFCLKKKK